MALEQLGIFIQPNIENPILGLFVGVFAMLITFLLSQWFNRNS